MAVYQHLRTSVPGRIPSAAEVAEGQIAINLADGKIFTKDSNGDVIGLGIDPAYSLPTASDTVLGGVKVGANLIIDSGTGVLSADLSSVIPNSAKGANNGVATLDGSGKLTSAQIPASLVGAVVYQTTWDASTNTPAIPAAAADNKGQYYIVGVAGTTAIDGHSKWAIGDWLVSDGTKWDYIDNSVAPLLQAATDTTLGGVKVASGSGLAVDGTGNLSVDTVDSGTF
jgi:hypothetical protein